MAEDQHLVRRAVTGDLAAFDALIRQHQSAVRGFLRRVTGYDHALADDLAQETFCQAFAKKSQFVDGSFVSWLYSIAWSRFLMEKRRDRRARAREELEVQSQSFDTVNVARLDLEKAMRHITAVESAAITLCLGLGYAHDEAAAILGLPLGTLKSHIARGREKVRSLFEENGHGP
jgi:RNA polymerase sigma factor (sigma-70 family)